MAKTRTTWTKGNGPPTAFRAGMSGNPSGRSRALVDVQALARTYTPAAIKALGDALNSPRERVAAAQALLDRAWGRPMQQVAVSGDADAIGLHLVAARAFVAELTKEHVQAQPTTIEGRAEGEPAFNVLDAPPPTE